MFCVDNWTDQSVLKQTNGMSDSSSMTAILFFNLQAHNIVQKSLLAHDSASGKKAVHSALFELNTIVETLEVPFHMGMKIRNRVFMFILRILKDKSNAEKFGCDKMLASETDIMEVWFTSDW